MHFKKLPTIKFLMLLKIILTPQFYKNNGIKTCKYDNYITILYYCTLYVIITITQPLKILKLNMNISNVISYYIRNIQNII